MFMVRDAHNLLRPETTTNQVSNMDTGQLTTDRLIIIVTICPGFRRGFQLSKPRGLTQAASIHR